MGVSHRWCRFARVKAEGLLHVLSEWRDIAVFLDGSAIGEQIGRRAASLAQRYKAHLVAVYGVAHEWNASDGYARGLGIKGLIASRRLSDEQKVLVAGRNFAALSKEYAISSEFRVVWRDGFSDDAVLRGLHCDLIVSADLRPKGLPESWSAEHLLLNTGIPVLVTPVSWSNEKIGETVVIAWNNSREAQRAVRDAMPFISNASRVTILIVDDEGRADALGEHPGINLLQHLSRRSAKVDIVRVPMAGASTAQALSEQAVKCGADLLVIGAYSCTRATEMLFGGTTRSLLNNVPVPMLISR